MKSITVFFVYIIMRSSQQERQSAINYANFLWIVEAKILATIVSQLPA